MSSNKPVSTNPLGQFRDEVVGEVKNVASDAAKSIVSEPKKILESILGSSGSSQSGSGEQGIEDIAATAGSGSQVQQQAIKQQQMIMKKQMEDKQRSQQLLSLHRQRLKEEEEYYKAKQQQGKMQEEQEKQQEEEEEKRSEIMQIERRSADIQKAQQLRGRMGSKEQGKMSH